jgi:2-octaprenylphenol hydroxylase
MKKVAVYGGGIVAMLLAIIFKEKSYQVELWRPYVKPESQVKNQRVFALNQKAMQLLKQLGVWSDLKHPNITSVHHMLVWDEQTAAQIQFAAGDIGQYALAHIVDEYFLWASILELVQRHEIPMIDLAAEEECFLQDNQWYITRSKADFLVIADGVRSKLREQLHVACERYSYQQIALVAKVKVSQGKDNTAFQVFGKHGPLAFLPLSSSGYYSIVWSCDVSYANKLLALSDAELREQMASAMGYHLGDVELVMGLQSYPLQMLHAKHYVGSNWLLAGDAAHHFHPLAGLGLNMGIGDVLALRDLSDLSLRHLMQYQRERRAVLTPVILGMKILKNCFGIQQPFWVKLRSLGMDFLDHQRNLKQLMMTMIQKL